MEIVAYTEMLQKIGMYWSLVGGWAHLFGKLGEHLEDGEAEGERGDGHRDVGLHCPGLHQLL